MTRSAQTGLLWLAVAGCWDLDRAKLDSLRCDSDADCRADRRCDDGYCVARACQDSAECGMPGVLACVEGLCAGRPCDGDDDCGAEGRCERGLCAPVVDVDAGTDAGVDCSEAACDDGLFCNGEESCADRACAPGEAPDCGDLDGPCGRGTCDEDQDRCVATDVCDDGLECTLDTCIEPAGDCEHEPGAGACLIDGACFSAGETNPANACQVCDPDLGQTAWTGEPLDDGLACTADRCDGVVVSHAPSDELCPEGEICSPCAGGCVARPAPTLLCDPTAAPGLPGATCVLGGLEPGQGACGSCDSVAGITPFARERFDDCPDLGQAGWVVSGSYDCPVDAAVGPDEAVQEDALQLGVGAWEGRLVSLDRVVDTRDFDRLRLCYANADRAAGAGSWVRVSLDTGTGWRAVDTLAGGPETGIDNTWFTRCLDLHDLDPEAVGHAALGVRVEVRANDGDGDSESMYLDDLALEAWHSGTLGDPEVVLDEGFDDCALDDWTVEGLVECPLDEDVGWKAPDALWAELNTWSIRRSVDVSAFCEDVWLSFLYGEQNMRATDYLQAFAGPRDAAWLVWANHGGASRGGPKTIDVGLSHADPSLQWAPTLDLAFTLSSAGAAQIAILDDVSVRGRACLPADGLVEIGPLADAGDGTYSFAVGATGQVTTYLTCRWDGRQDAAARATITFQR